MSAFLAQPVILVEPNRDGRKSAALVTHVHNATYVNVVSFLDDGPTGRMSSIRFFGVDEVVPDGMTQSYCTPAGWE